MPQGVVLKFNAERGFGFIASEDGDVFLHVREMVNASEADHLRPDVQVKYTLSEGPQGRRRAKQVRILRLGGHDLSELVRRAAEQFDELGQTMDDLIAAAREYGLDV
jgi:cold shock CspA family protein